jgi:hypothetical protein
MKNTEPVNTVVCDNLRCLRIVLESDAISVTTNRFVEDDGSPGVFHFCCEDCFHKSEAYVRTGGFCVPLKIPILA